VFDFRQLKNPAATQNKYHFDQRVNAVGLFLSKDLLPIAGCLHFYGALDYNHSISYAFMSQASFD